MPPELEAFLVTHHHMLTAAEAAELGLTREFLRKLERAKVLTRVGRGAYVQTSVLQEQDHEDQRHRLVARAVLRTYRNGWAASHTTAAVVWGLPVRNASLDRIHVAHTRPIGRSRRHGTGDGAITVHTCPGQDLVTEHDGVRTVDPHTAVLGTALIASQESAVMAADAALHRKLVTPESLNNAVARMSRVPGVTRARKVLELSDGRSESPGESRLRLILRDLGLHAIPQFAIEEGGRVIARVDFYLPRIGVVLEFDGMLKYKAGEQRPADRATPDPVIKERGRERSIRALGYGVGRVTWGELDRPEVIRLEVARAKAAVRPDLITRLSNGNLDLRAS